MSARDLLAAATPTPWSWNADAWAIVGPHDQDAIVGGPDETLIFSAPNLGLAIRAVNEYEALLDIEDGVKALLSGVPLPADPLVDLVLGLLARLDAVRSGT